MTKINFIKKCWRCPSGKYAWQVLDTYGAVYDSGKEDTRTEAEKVADQRKREQIRKALEEMPEVAQSDVTESRKKYKTHMQSLFTKKGEHHAKAT